MIASVDAPIWLLTDDKPGHRNQLRGLGDRLTALSGRSCRWISTVGRRPSLWQCWRGANLAPELAAPALVIAAGSATQRALLATRRHFGCPAVLLMKPNFPYGWIDAAIVPAHDNPPARPNVLATRGVLNAVTPNVSPPQGQRGLMLIGGASKHFGWDQNALLGQIETLCREAPDWHWTLTDSRRTPPGLLAALAARRPPNLELVAHAETSPDWLPAQLRGSRRAWVTPDSVSMVYEALTAGVPTGLFALPDAGRGRVVGGLRQLERDRLVTTFAQRANLGALPPPRLWEAERAARWLMQRFSLAGAAGGSR